MEQSLRVSAAGVIAAVLALATHGHASEQMWRVTVKQEWIEGDYAPPKSGLPNFANDVEDGQGQQLRVRYSAESGWYLVAQLARARLSYDAFFLLDCPVSAATVIFFPGHVAFCTDNQNFFAGVEDEFLQSELRIGWEHEFVDGWAWDAELAYVYGRWDNDGDGAARDVADCVRRNLGRSNVIPECDPVSRTASEDGFGASAGLRYRFAEKWSIRVGAAWQNWQHQIYRTKMARDLRAANCNPQRCSRPFDPSPSDSDGSELSYESSLDWQFSDHWSLNLGYRGEGNSTWRRYQLGLSYSF